MKVAAIGLAVCVLVVSSLAADKKAEPATKGKASASRQKKITTTTPAPKPVDLRLSNPANTDNSTVSDGDSPLVRAAKSSRGKKKSRISISDADVKTSSGHFVNGPSTAARDITPTPEDPQAKVIEENKAKEQKAQAGVAQERVDKARQRVIDLEGDLRRLEENYYNETDTTYRDDVLEQRYTETRDQLEKARQDLTEAQKQQEPFSKQ